MNRRRTSPQATGQVTASADGTSTVVYERRFDDYFPALSEHYAAPHPG